MFNGNFMNKMRSSNGGNQGNKYQTQSYNQYD